MQQLLWLFLSLLVSSSSTTTHSLLDRHEELQHTTSEEALVSTLFCEFKTIHCHLCNHRRKQLQLQATPAFASSYYFSSCQ
jgi:hypothetical protein